MTDPTNLPLIFARTLGVCWLAPAFSTPAFGARLRFLLAGWLTAAIAPMVADGPASSRDIQGWALALFGEAATGGILGISAALIVAGAKGAGEIVGAQAGLSAAALFDPEAVDGLTPTGHLYGLLALSVFLALDGPLRVVRALIESYEAWPIGGVLLSSETAVNLFGRVGDTLALALRAAAPTAAALTMAGLVLALMARAAPSLPFSAMSLPIRSALGLFLIALGLVALVATFAAVWRELTTFHANCTNSFRKL